MDKLRHNNKILIIGGYGEVGYAIAKDLAPSFPAQVIIAGRNLDQAQAAAAAIGHGVEGRGLDITAPDDNALTDVGLVMVCLDQNDTRFARHCLAHGIHYLDISANDHFLSQVEHLDSLARQAGATALLSLGVAPGLTNLLAAHLCRQLDTLERLDIVLEFGLRDKHGKAALMWMFDNLDAQYQVNIDGQKVPVQSFGDHLEYTPLERHVSLPAYRFNFSDQHVLARTLNIPSVSTWVCFENRFATQTFAILSRLGLGKLLRRPTPRKLAIWLMSNLQLGSNRCNITVFGDKHAPTGKLPFSVGVHGYSEAKMTALIAAEAVRQVFTTEQPPGVHHSEQVLALAPILQVLKQHMPDITIHI
ncbi:saccharopine dehydrogenase NADP-binding domain-containing protein [Photobacterium sp. MCCC 1A19761]|uniref:saccharopine dehydrogenase family protein n=1 Tax=Photobacterium sp. MCCC 1A19761 TaxID=3115000 RepID=UPI00307F55DB